jgi:hypothetical protein
MTISAIVRSGQVRGEGGPALPAAVAAAPGAGGDDPTVRTRRPWWRRWIESFPRQPDEEFQRERLERLLALLEAAREELTVGWMQDGWWSVPRADGQQALVSGLAAGVSGPEPVSAVCLVGGLVRAAAGQGPEAEAGLAIAAVYDALWESRGQPPGPWAVPSPQARLAQVRVLTRWNDAEGRTGEEVLAILDRAISRTMLSLAAIPAPQGNSSAWPGPELAEKNPVTGSAAQS